MKDQRTNYESGKKVQQLNIQIYKWEVDKSYYWLMNLHVVSLETYTIRHHNLFFGELLLFYSQMETTIQAYFINYSKGDQ